MSIGKLMFGIKKLTDIFFSDKGRNIFSHEANGEPCTFCGKPMKGGQAVTRVGTGEKMHQGCWSGFFEKKIENLKVSIGRDD